MLYLILHLYILGVNDGRSQGEVFVRIENISHLSGMPNQYRGS
jgi:hypothetical protein